MRIQVEYSDTGEITAIAIPANTPGQSVFAELRPQAAHNTAYVEARDLSSQLDFERLNEIKATLLVEGAHGFHRLIPRTDPAK